MVLYAIAVGDVGTPKAVVLPAYVVAQQRDDSLAFDLALAGSSGLLAWDEATSAERGVIRTYAFSKDHAGSTRDISPPDSDAELPRVFAFGAGFVAIWVARRPEPASPSEAGPEATGELRSYGWLEMLALDRQGIPAGPVRPLTPSSGHVSAFDAAVRADNGVPLLVVAARDDGEVVDGSGGALLRVRVRGDAIESAVAFATDGLGRGAPSFVGSAAAPSSPFALAWVGKEEQVRLLPLDGSGAPTSTVSAEDAMSEARPLLFLVQPGADAAAPRSMMLVAAPSDAAAQLRAFMCAAAP
jgi:hypothetical protein